MQDRWKECGLWPSSKGVMECVVLKQYVKMQDLKQGKQMAQNRNHCEHCKVVGLIPSPWSTFTHRA